MGSCFAPRFPVLLWLRPTSLRALCYNESVAPFSLYIIWFVVVLVVVAFTFRYRIFRVSRLFPFCFNFLGVVSHLIQEHGAGRCS